MSHPKVVAIGEPVSVGVTLGDFINGLWKLGLSPSMPLASIEVGIAKHGSGQMVAEINEQNEVELREL